MIMMQHNIEMREKGRIGFLYALNGFVHSGSDKTRSPIKERIPGVKSSNRYDALRLTRNWEAKKNDALVHR